MRIPFQELYDTLLRVLLVKGFSQDRAALCARLFAETTLDGVYSHGLNRFPRFIKTIDNGTVDIHAEPQLISSFGSLERWDGRRGPGNLNAYYSMQRAIELARTHGAACVALANTNHWMRGGSYGRQAADAGMIGICWTNTLPNLPPWGSSRPRLGNNPLVIAAPRAEGHVVLDMAMSQFSWGAIESYRARGESLPVAGGYDATGMLTRDPAAIEESKRMLPIGFWKGSGLALMLDTIAATLSGGLATHQISADPNREVGLSQVFIAIDPTPLNLEVPPANVVDAIVRDIHSTSEAAGETVRYPGERTIETRLENLKKGVPVDPSIWNRLRTI